MIPIGQKGLRLFCFFLYTAKYRLAFFTLVFCTCVTSVYDIYY
jgi:hypothetical protein